MLEIFGTGHGKSPCDGVGGTVKRVIARMSLQRPVEGQILTVKQMHETASKNITGIQEEVEATKSELEERFRNAENLPGTCSFHSITALNNHI
jgi:hypothetical protein